MFELLLSGSHAHRPPLPQELGVLLPAVRGQGVYGLYPWRGAAGAPALHRARPSGTGHRGPGRGVSLRGGDVLAVHAAGAVLEVPLGGGGGGGTGCHHGLRFLFEINFLVFGLNLSVTKYFLFCFFLFDSAFKENKSIDFRETFLKKKGEVSL